MKIFWFVRKTTFLILIWINWIAVHGYSYHSPQTLDGKHNERHLKYYHFSFSNEPLGPLNSQQYASPPAKFHTSPSTIQQQNFHQLLQSPVINSASYAAQNLIGSQINNPINHHTNFMNGNGKPSAEKPGNYLSQSEASQLDQYPYPYKQKTAGDNRSFTRYITTCYQGGRCDSSTMEAGAIDQNNQQILQKLRATVEYGSPECAKGSQNYKNSVVSQPNLGPIQNQVGSVRHSSYPVLPLQQVQQPYQHQQLNYGRHNNFGNVQPQSQISSIQAFPQTQIPNRPAERRLYPYTEVVQPNEFN